MRSGIASAERSGPAAASRSTSRRRACARRDRASTSRSRSRSSPPRGQVPSELLAVHASLGELALDGRIRPVGGALAVAEGARRSGLERMLCAPQSAAEVALAGIEPVPVRHLAEAVGVPRGRGRAARVGAGGDEAASPAPLRPTSPTCAGRSARGARSSSRPRAATTCSSPGRRAPARRCSPGACPGSCRRSTTAEALEVTRIHSVAGLAPAERPRRPRARRSARRTTAPRPPRSSAAGPGRGPGRRASRTAACSCSTSCRSSSGRRSRRCGSRSRTASSASPASAGRALFPARFQLVGTMNLCPCGARGDPRRRVHVLAAAARRVPRQALARAARPLRPRRRVPRPRAAELAAGPAEASAPVRAGWWRRASGWRGPPLRRTREADALLDRAVERLPLSGRGRARVARVARTIAALAGCRRRRAGARGRGAVVPLADASSSARERARARRVRSRRRSRTCARASRWRRSLRASTSVPYRAELERARAPLRRPLRRPAFPPLLAAIHDPPPGLFLRGCAPAELLAQAGVAVVGARACSRATARRSARRARRELAAAGLVVVSGLARGDRRRGASRRARGGRARRSPCSAAASTATIRRRTARSRPDRRERAGRVRVRAGRRAGAVAVPGAQPDRRRALRRDGRRRGARAERRARSRPTRARGGPRGVRRPGRDHAQRSRAGRTRCSGSARRR